MPSKTLIDEQADTISTANWSEWDPYQYLTTYFSDESIGTDSIEAWKFLSRELRNIDSMPCKILDFGSGPTLFGTIPCSAFATEIHVSDYLQCNLDTIQSWIDNDADAFDWKNCIKEVLIIEGNHCWTEDILKRESELRKKITTLKRCDASKSPAIQNSDKYPLVVSTYCVDSATSSKETWHLYMKNLLELVDEGGTILLTALQDCESYKVGDYSFPSANINEQDMKEALLKNSFAEENFQITICDAPDCENEGFTGLIFVRAKK